MHFLCESPKMAVEAAKTAGETEIDSANRFNHNFSRFNCHFIRFVLKIVGFYLFFVLLQREIEPWRQVKSWLLLAVFRKL